LQVVKRKEIANYVRGFIGLSAPYDISDHYIFESERVVGPFNGTFALLGCLQRAELMEASSLRQGCTRSRP
jgi:hypothetical protein